MKTCPYNTEGVLSERPFQWAAIRLPWARSAIARLDDRLNRGSINPLKKWWVDIEMIDGTPVPPLKGANTRELSFDKKARETARFAFFPPDPAPPGPDGMAPFPLDRQAGIDAANAAELPDEARRGTTLEQSIFVLSPLVASVLSVSIDPATLLREQGI